VREYIGATYDNVNNIYTIMGLTVSGSVFDAQVNYADNMLISYIGQIDVSSPKYQTAKLCGLNLAGLRIIVVATGGFVSGSLGALSYRLGDIYASKEESVRLAIDYAIKIYDANYRELLLRITGEARRIDSDVKRSYYYDYDW
jgi:hypothetical protein